MRALHAAIERTPAAGWPAAQRGSALALPSRIKWATGVVVAVAVAIIAAQLPSARRAWVMHELRGAAGDTGMAIPYLTDPPAIRGGTAPPFRLSGAAARVLNAAADDPSAAGAYDRGLALLLAGDTDGAIDELRLAAQRAPRNPETYTALAESYRRRARARNDASELGQALVAARRAIDLDPNLPAARYQWAAALDDLGAAAQARQAWLAVKRADPSSAWSAEIDRQIVPAPEWEATLWSSTIGSADAAAAKPPERFIALARGNPRMARMWTESMYLAEWAKAYTSGDRAAAGRALDVSRRFAAVVRGIAGETLVGEAVAAIDEATAAGDSARLATLARAHSVYQEGRSALFLRRTSQAIETLHTAADAFRQGRSPMAEVATAYMGVGLSESGKMPEAVDTFLALLAREENRPGHRALRAQTLRELGLCMTLLGRWSEAQYMLRKSATEYEALGETQHVGMARMLLASALDLTGNRSEAWNERVKALRLLSKVGDSTNVAKSMADATFAAIEARNWEEARALTVPDVEAATGAGDSLLLALAWLRRAVIEVSSSADPGQSLNEAVAAAEKVPDEDAVGRMRADVEFVRALDQRRRAPAAGVAGFTRTIDYYRAADLVAFLPNLHLERARASERAGNLDAAWDDLITGMDLLDRQHDLLPDRSWRSGIFDHSQELFDDAIRLALRRADTRAAFEAAERGRARALLEQKNVPPAADLKELQQRIGNGALFELVQLPEKLVVFVVSRHGLQVVERPVSAEAMEAMVRELTDRIRRRAPVVEVQQAGAVLLDLLIAPGERVTGEIAGPLVIVADGVMRAIPYAALYDPLHGAYLIQAHPFVLAPSAAVFLQGGRQLDALGTEPPRSAYLISNPAFDDSRFTRLDRLEGADREAEAIRGLYPQVSWRKHEEATRERFIEEAPRYQVVQFGGHAVASGDVTRDSFLLFSGREGRVEDAGTLYGRDIVRLRFTATRVVVLAACGSMQGDAAGREGLPTIARAFLAAGVPAVVGTLWRIDDDVSSSLVVAFHRELAGGRPPEEALRTVQLQMLREGHPADWAAFEVIGSTASGRQIH